MRRRLGFTLWCIGLPGILVLASVLAQSPPPGLPSNQPAWVIGLASGLQSVLLLSVAVFVGTRIAPRIGLHAPVLAAALAGTPLHDLLRSRLGPAVAGGMAGVAILLAHAALLPPELRGLQQQHALPLIVRILYGGFTEEILLRWGMMTALAWSCWRIGKGQDGVLARWMGWTAIVISAIVFGVAHLPAAQAFLGELGAQLALLIVASNAVFGMLAGYLFWRWGLETAMAAHVFAHLGFSLATGG